MSFVHGKNTVIIINGTDISAFCNSTEDADTNDMHEVTTYGAARKAYASGLGDGVFTLGGFHDDTSSGPRKVLKALQRNGTLSTFVFRPSGTGVGKQQSSVSVFVKSYTDTAPAGGMITWKSTLQMSGALNEADQ